MTQRQKSVVGWASGILAGLSVPMLGVAVVTWHKTEANTTAIERHELKIITLESKIDTIADGVSFLRGKAEGK